MQHQTGQDERQDEREGPQELIQHEELPVMDPAADKLALQIGRSGYLYVKSR